MNSFNSKNMPENVINIKITMAIFLSTTNCIISFSCWTRLNFVTYLSTTFTRFLTSKIKKIISIVIDIRINPISTSHLLISICTNIDTLFSLAYRMAMFWYSIWLIRIIIISKKRTIKLIIHISLFVSLPIFFCSV